MNAVAEIATGGAALRAWREGRGFSERVAAHRLGISAATLTAIEANTIEVGASLATDIYRRTGGVVSLGVEPDPASSSRGCFETPDAAAPGRSTGAAERSPLRAAAPDAPQPPPQFTVRALPDDPGSVWLRREPPCGHAEGWVLSANRAAELGMQLIRAALAANRGNDQ